MRVYVLVKKILDGPALFWAIPYPSAGHWTTDLNQAKHYSTERAVHIGWTAVSRRHNRVEVELIDKNEGD